MPLDESMFLAELLDEVRRQIGVEFTQDKLKPAN